MAAAVAHRGPDAEGSGSTPGVRPRSASPTAGCRSSTSRTRPTSRSRTRTARSWRCLNGEIYNFADLRREQEPRHRFRSHGDTETIVHGYEEQGDRIVESLDGMFALALWDARQRRLLLARDPFGKKPLYYWSDGRELLFASEIKALLAAGAPAAFDASGLPEYLAFGYVPTPRTLYRDVFRAAARLHPGRRRERARRAAARTGTCSSRRRARRCGCRWRRRRKACRDRLAAAVKKRLVADVPLGVLLSGGVDSAAVLALRDPGRGHAHAHLHAGLRGRRPSTTSARRPPAWPATSGADPPRGRASVRRRRASWRRCCTTTTSRSATRRRCPPTSWRRPPASTSRSC